MEKHKLHVKWNNMWIELQGFHFIMAFMNGVMVFILYEETLLP